MRILERPGEKYIGKRVSGTSSFSLTLPVDPAGDASTIGELLYGSPKGEHSEFSSLSSSLETGETRIDHNKGFVFKKCKTFLDKTSI